MNFIKKIFFNKPTASDKIVVKHLNMPSKSLERGVKVDVFLPPQYGSDRRAEYPAIFFNDGQDMLALGMYDTLTRLYAEKSLRPCIIFAIYCNENRINEYGVTRQPDYKNRGNKAREYRDFVIHELVPMMQKEFKIKTTAADTTFAGFSLGALSALDIAWGNPSVFGKAGVFSGSLWWRSQEWTAQDPDKGRIMHDIISSSSHQKGMKFWFEVGTEDEKEDRNNNGVIDAIDDTVDLIDEFTKLGYRPHEDITYLEVLGGEHNPHTWGRVMPDFLKWALMKDADFQKAAF